MKECETDRIKEFTLQDIMQLSQDIETIQEDIAMMKQFFNTDDIRTIKKKQ